MRSANFRGKLPQSNRDSPHHTPSFSAVSRPFTTSVSSLRVKIPPRVRSFECAIDPRVSSSYIRFERHFMFLLNCMHAVFTSTRIFCVTSGFQTYSESGFPVDLSPQSLYFVDASVSHHCGKSYPVWWTRVDDHFSIDVAQVGRIKNSPPPEEAVVILSEEKRMGNIHTPYTLQNKGIADI